MTTSVDVPLHELRQRGAGPTASDRRGSIVSEHDVGDAESDYKAWLCVLGGIAFTIPSYGFMQSVGTVQSYIYENQLSTYSAGSIGWITGLYLFLSYFLNIQIGPLCDKYGPVIISLTGAVITIASFVLLAECTTYWQFVLCLGVLGAIGGAIIATIALSVIVKVFRRRRGIAMGIALTGSAIGSIVFPLMLRSTLPDLGWQWSMRLMALIVAAIMIPVLFCFVPYYGFTVVLDRQEGWNGFISTLPRFSTFQSPAFVVLCVGIFMLEFATFGITSLLPTIATRSGFGPTEGYTLIAVMGACSFMGRVVPGCLFIHFSHISRPILYAFSAMWGLGSGSFLSIPPVCIGKTCDVEEYGRYYGASTFITSFAVLLSVPLSGIMLDSLGVRALAGLLGAAVFVGGICVSAARGTFTSHWYSIKEKI
ncbi:major facilitator superfamily domain-containing protein [Aspergillus karnatakaensis]|uniref:major facilitator superfamily domain-containing protein n=1 Tax=Aspergillus karnatakaensis TaxID=1810916 RepID=UPI003CCDE1E0